ncbi:MAG: hypothetical protein ABI268_04135, partial [Rhodanobacter sp.]
MSFLKESGSTLNYKKLAYSSGLKDGKKTPPETVAFFVSLPVSVPEPVQRKRPPMKVAQVFVLIGGRYKDRTCDPLDVNEVLYR